MIFKQALRSTAHITGSNSRLWLILFILVFINQSVWSFTSVSPDRFEQALWDEKTTLLDVRTPQEYAQGHIPGAALANMQEPAFVDNVRTLLQNKADASGTIAVYCRSGKRSKQAATALENAGYTIIELDGGFLEWQKAKKPIAKGSYSHLQRFTEHTFAINKNVNLHYRQTTTGTHTPTTLIVYLHSSSARGIDNELPIRRWGTKCLINYLDSTACNAWVIFPQCRKDRYWNEYRPILGCTMSEALYRLIKQFQTEHSIERTYIIGESFGGTGVWRMLTDYPSLFDAGMVIASYPGKNTKAKKVAKTPICIVAGENDTYSDPRTEAIITQLQQYKAVVRYNLLPQADHVQTCIQALSTENLDWLLQQ